MTSPRRAGVSRCAAAIAAVGFLGSVSSFGLRAQESQAPEAEAAPAQEEQVAEGQQAARALQFARVADDEVALRCFATEQSPTYDDKLVKGDVVALLETDGAFRRIGTPLGPIGYVHSKFVTRQEDGSLVSSGNKLSFRYRPSRGAPVMLVDEGVQFWPLAQEKDWWRVRFVEAPAWVPASALESVEGSGRDELQTAYEGLGGRQREAVAAAMQEHVRSVARAAEEAERSEALAALRTDFLTERQRPLQERDFTAVKDALGTFVAGLDEASAVREPAQQLGEAIEREEYYARLQAVIAEPEQPAEVEEIYTPAAPDPLDRFHAIGWIRYDSGGLTGTPSIRLEKAGQLILNVTCSTGRYNLRMFDGMEVGLTGPVGRPHEQAMRAIDVQGMEVIGAARR